MHEHTNFLADHHGYNTKLSDPCYWHRDVNTLYDTYFDFGEDLRNNLDELSSNVQYEYMPEQVVSVNKDKRSLEKLLLQIMGLIFLILGSESCRRQRIINRLRGYGIMMEGNSWN